MTLEQLGYTPYFEDSRKMQNLDSFSIGRVILEHKERYIVKSDKGEFDAEIIGNLRYSAQKSSDFPAVGDWVAISEYDESKAIIHAVLPRKTKIERQAVGKPGEKQIIASNIDYAFIIQAVDRDFNINRIERFLTICSSSNVESIILLNKIDTISNDELSGLQQKLQKRVNEIPVLAISNHTLAGYDQLFGILKKAKTYCLLGSSGVGKSSLLNRLSGKELMETGNISNSTSKGRHITSHRELVILDNGSIIIDNPGMREVGIADSGSGLESTFENIVTLAENCRFKDCTHVHEKGCAVLAGLKTGEIDKASYNNYLKLEREKEHYDSTISEKRQKDKDFGKMVKSFKKHKNRNRQNE